MSALALFVALGGTAIAVTSAPKNSVNSKSIAKGSVKSSDIQNKKGVKGKDVKNNDLTGKDIDESTLKAVPSVEKLAVFGDSTVKATATNGASEAAARTAAPEIPL